MGVDIVADNEWLEADGLGGYASGTATGIRTRRYHALLLAAVTPPTGRYVLVNGFDAWIMTPDGTYAISSQQYTPGVTSPDGVKRILSFDYEPWPKWRFQIEDGCSVEFELAVPRGHAAVVLRWHFDGDSADHLLRVRPFLSGRDYHSLHHENPVFQFEPTRMEDRFVWKPYPDVPGIHLRTNGAYEHKPDWYRDFQYDQERNRGLDFTEDLAAPGIITWHCAQDDAVLMLAAEGQEAVLGMSSEPPAAAADRIFRLEQKRRGLFPSPLHRSADAYLVQRNAGETILAGYPWFTDWGRDTFIALRGLCLATGRMDEARRILVRWADEVSAGMLPNCFPDKGTAPTFNSVDASLWYIVAVHDYLHASSGGNHGDDTKMRRAAEAILEGYSNGTRYGIHADTDGLLASGEEGVQLTWMDAKIGNWVVTPRIGKPVEVQALWLNALRIGGEFSDRWEELYERGLASFRSRFWNAARGCLFDVIDVDHHPGTVDPTFRPNQIFAVGGLPYPVLDGARARQVVVKVETRLWTPLGLRSLAPGEPGYCPRYEGGIRDRDSAYHEGTVWPWLLGAFVEAWLAVHDDLPDAASVARERFVTPLLHHLNEAGLGHVSEIADAQPPHTPRGCPFQAWSLAELIRLQLAVLV